MFSGVNYRINKGGNEMITYNILDSNVVAIWDRSKIAPNSKSIFCLLKNGELKEIDVNTEYAGTNANGKRIYKETGHIEISEAFKETDRFTFKKANYFIKHFGGELLVKLQ